MRQKLDEQLIDAVIADWEAGKVSSIMAADFFAKYGLGTQTESVSVEDVKEQARAIVEEFTRVARDWGHTEQEIHQGLARLARAARTPHHEEEQ